MSGKTAMQWIAVSCVLGALTAYALRPDGRPVAEAATSAGALTFTAGFPEADRQSVLAAVAGARPEARQLIDAVAGRTRVRPFYEPDGFWLGWARPLTSGGYDIRLNLARLDGERRIDRNAITLHELGHIVDF